MVNQFHNPIQDTNKLMSHKKYSQSFQELWILKISEYSVKGELSQSP